jgi:hypothetical protein
VNDAVAGVTEVFPPMPRSLARSDESESAVSGDHFRPAADLDELFDVEVVADHPADGLLEVLAINHCDRDLSLLRHGFSGMARPRTCFDQRIACSLDM